MDELFENDSLKDKLIWRKRPQPSSRGSTSEEDRVVDKKDAEHIEVV